MAAQLSQPEWHMLDSPLYYEDLLAKAAGMYARPIQVDGGELIVEHTAFVQNNVDSGGGAVYVAATAQSSTVTISSSQFAGNSAVSGGAIYIADPALACDEQCRISVSVSDSEFSGNEARKGGAIFSSHGLISLMVSNSLFY
eukprot:SAG22_NODE_4051_length_1405_cov_1.330781_1_plen_141_part_10